MEPACWDTDEGCFIRAMKNLTATSELLEFFPSLALAFRSKELTSCLLTKADVAELADALDSKSSSRK